MSVKKKIIRNEEKPIQKFRFAVQALFAALCLWIGIEFYLFVSYLESGGINSYLSRPPGVDGFLPISSLMSFYYFITTGHIHSAHPAGMFIFLRNCIDVFSDWKIILQLAVSDRVYF